MTAAGRAPDHLILGAGLAGLTLALELRTAGVGGSIVLVDRRTSFGRDRTWCCWDVVPGTYSGVARRSWPTWEVVTAGGAVRQHDGRHAYRCFDSRDVYAHALARLEADPGVELRLGETVLEVDAAATRARTDVAAYEPGRLYDALAFASPRLRRRGRGAVEWRQGFLGWDVEVQRPRFEPGVATLMDFRVPQIGSPPALRFLYVLPESPTRALVEDTTFAAAGPPAADRRAVLEAALDGADYTVHFEERGLVPMTDVALDLQPGPRTYAVGTGGGAVRPSSGYAFTRVQRHCRALARAVAAGVSPPARVASRRSALMDAIFLRALSDDPAAFPERFGELLARTSPGTFARFMDDAATPADELAVIAALPKVPFVAAAARTAEARR